MPFIKLTKSFQPKTIDIIVERNVNKLIIPPNILNNTLSFIFVKFFEEISPILYKISNGIPNITLIPLVKSYKGLNVLFISFFIY